MSAYDQLYRYLFKQADVRGELVRVQDSFEHILATHEYPHAVQQLLGELMAATSLLTATLKFEGDIAVQIQSEGPIKYAVVNGTENQELRGVARWEGEVSEYDFKTLFQNGIMAITITPKQGERYQGIVALDQPSLAACLEGYFSQSEQLPTCVVLHTRLGDKPATGGMLIQALPAGQGSAEQFDHLAHLTATVKAEELFDLAPLDVLHRLYHEEEVEVYDPVTLQFKCSCSKERSAAALINVPKEELLGIVAEEGDVAIKCQYCNTSYRFDAIDVEAIHSGSYSASEPTSN